MANEGTLKRDQNRSGLAASNSNARPQRRQPVQLPEVVSSDVLGTMLDEDLNVRLRALDDACRRAYEDNVDTQPWEVEIAYLKREQQLRRPRRDIHMAWVRKVEDDFNRVEMTLPAGDFDNSAFVYAATGGRQWGNR